MEINSDEWLNWLDPLLKVFWFDVGILFHSAKFYLIHF